MSRHQRPGDHQTDRVTVNVPSGPFHRFDAGQRVRQKNRKDLDLPDSSFHVAQRMPAVSELPQPTCAPDRDHPVTPPDNQSDQHAGTTGTDIKENTTMTTDPATSTGQILVATTDVAVARDLMCRDLIHDADGRRIAAKTWRADDPDRRAATLLDALASYTCELPVTDYRLAQLAVAIRGHDTDWPIVINLDALVDPLLDQQEIDLDHTLTRLLGFAVPPEADGPSELTTEVMAEGVDQLLALSAQVNRVPTQHSQTNASSEVQP